MRRHLPDTVRRHLPRLHHELGWASWRSSTTTVRLLLSMNLDTATSSETYISPTKEMTSTGKNYYRPVAARVGWPPQVACRETSLSTFLLPSTSSLQPDTIMRSRIPPCVTGPHTYLAYFIALDTSLPSALGGLSPLPSKWALCSGARASLCPPGVTASPMLVYFLSPETHLRYRWGFGAQKNTK